MKKIIFLFACLALTQTVSAQTDSIKAFADDKFRPAAEKNGVKVSTADVKSAVTMLNNAVNKKVNKADSLNMPSVVGHSDSTALIFKIAGATGHERMKIGQNEFTYKNHNNATRLHIHQLGASFYSDTAASFSYNLYLNANKRLSPTATWHEGLWIDNYVFASKGDSLATTVGSNNNGIFVNKSRRKASWMGYGTAPDSGYIAGLSGVEIVYGHSFGASEDARTNWVKGVNIALQSMSGRINNAAALYMQVHTSWYQASRITNAYGIYQDAATWKNVLTGSTGFGTATPQGAIDVVSTTQFAYPLPRMTTAQRDAITPQVGAMLINTDTQRAQMWSNGMWIDL